MRLGDWSYSLYLGHFLVISALSRLWAPVSAPGTLWDNALAAIAMTAASMMLAWLAFTLFERPVIGAAARLRHRIFEAQAPEGGRIASRIW